MEIESREAKRVAVGLLARARYYHVLYPMAQLLLWAGTLCAACCCAILLGLTFTDRFSRVPVTGYIYVTIVVSGTSACAAFIAWSKPKKGRRRATSFSEEDLAAFQSAAGGDGLDGGGGGGYSVGAAAAPERAGVGARAGARPGSSANWRTTLEKNGDPLAQCFTDLWDCAHRAENLSDPDSPSSPSRSPAAKRQRSFSFRSAPSSFRLNRLWGT